MEATYILQRNNLFKLFFQEKDMRLDEVLQGIPYGRFRVFGRDNFEIPDDEDERYFRLLDETGFVPDYESREEAIAVARAKAEEGRKHFGEGTEDEETNEIATTFYVSDTKGNILYGVL